MKIRSVVLESFHGKQTVGQPYMAKLTRCNIATSRCKRAKKLNPRFWLLDKHMLILKAKYEIQALFTTHAHFRQSINRREDFD